ncbi:hypothetical protein, partial [Chloroflexus sp.]|uniref:hypothetical protein n=1 Tax=Chloroflexus sp. TaxID=1904827 RepID=UPI00404AF06E
QHGCRTPNVATRAYRAGKVTNPVRDGIGADRQSSLLLCQCAGSKDILWLVIGKRSSGRW